MLTWILIIIIIAEEEHEVWNDSESDCHPFSEGEPDSPPPLKPAEDTNKQKALATWMTIIILYLHVKHYLTAKFTSRFFQLLKILFTVIGKFSFCVSIALSLPSTLYQAYKRCDIGKECFKRYVVCRKCHQVYFLRECIEGSGANRKSKLCSYIQGP